MKSKRELSRELESRREHQRRKNANLAMERTPSVNVRWWTTILPMLKFPRYLYAREHDATTKSAVRSDCPTLSDICSDCPTFARIVRKNVDRHFQRHSIVDSHFAKSSHVSRDDNATFSELTKSANEEPGGVLRNRNRSICVQPDDLRNARQLS